MFSAKHSWATPGCRHIPTSPDHAAHDEPPGPHRAPGQYAIPPCEDLRRPTECLQRDEMTSRELTLRLPIRFYLVNRCAIEGAFRVHLTRLVHLTRSLIVVPACFFSSARILRRTACPRSFGTQRHGFATQRMGSKPCIQSTDLLVVCTLQVVLNDCPAVRDVHRSSSSAVGRAPWCPPRRPTP
jgi:hypothetical protein